MAKHFLDKDGASKIVSKLKGLINKKQDEITSTNKLSYNLLKDTPAIPSAVTESTVSGWGFTKNTGTVTSVSVKMNGSSKGTVSTSGTIDLGTVITAHQDISGKMNKTDNMGTVRYHTLSVNAAAAASNNTYKALTWKANVGIVPQDGMILSIKMPSAGHDYGIWLSLDNGTTYKPIAQTAQGTNRLTTHYPNGEILTLQYNSAHRCDSMFPATSYASARTNVTGSWVVLNNYNSDSGNFNHRELRLRPMAAENLYRYKIFGLDTDGKAVPLTITDQTNTTIVQKTKTSLGFRPSLGLFSYQTTTNTAKNAMIPNDITYKAVSDLDARYTFNSDITGGRMLYIKGTYYKNKDLFKLHGTNNTNWYVQVPNNSSSALNLANYFESGYFYMLVAVCRDTNMLSLLLDNPLYFFDGTNLIPYQNMGGSGSEPNSLSNTDIDNAILSGFYEM